MSTPNVTQLTIQEQLNIESAFRHHMDEIVQKANTITQVGNPVTDLCGRSAAQNLYQVMTQYNSVEATVFWMEYQVSRNTQNKVLFPHSLKVSVEKALRDKTIPQKIIDSINTQNPAIVDAIYIRYAIQLIAFITRYIRIRTKNNS